MERSGAGSSSSSGLPSPHVGSRVAQLQAQLSKLALQASGSAGCGGGVGGSAGNTGALESPGAGRAARGRVGHILESSSFKQWHDRASTGMVPPSPGSSNSGRGAGGTAVSSFRQARPSLPHFPQSRSLNSSTASQAARHHGAAIAPQPPEGTGTGANTNTDTSAGSDPGAAPSSPSPSPRCIHRPAWKAEQSRVCPQCMAASPGLLQQHAGGQGVREGGRRTSAPVAAAPTGSAVGEGRAFRRSRSVAGAVLAHSDAGQACVTGSGSGSGLASGGRSGSGGISGVAVGLMSPRGGGALGGSKGSLVGGGVPAGSGSISCSKRAWESRGMSERLVDPSGTGSSTSCLSPPCRPTTPPQADLNSASGAHGSADLQDLAAGVGEGEGEREEVGVGVKGGRVAASPSPSLRESGPATGCERRVGSETTAAAAAAALLARSEGASQQLVAAAPADSAVLPSACASPLVRASPGSQGAVSMTPILSPPPPLRAPPPPPPPPSGAGGAAGKGGKGPPPPPPPPGQPRKAAAGAAGAAGSGNSGNQGGPSAPDRPPLQSFYWAKVAQAGEGSVWGAVQQEGANNE